MSSTSSSDLFRSTLKVLGKTHAASGETIVQAIENLSPGSAVGASVLTLSKGDTSKERILGNLQTRRLFSPNKLQRQIALKQVSQMFDGFDL